LVHILVSSDMVINASQPRVYSLSKHLDERGQLISVEFPQQPMVRFYFINTFVSQKSRGFHAHKTLSQIFIPIEGSWKIKLTKGGESQEFVLTSGENCLHLPPGYWREFESLENPSILGILADDVYREDDYIRDIDEFKAWEKQK